MKIPCVGDPVSTGRVLPEFSSLAFDRRIVIAFDLSAFQGPHKGGRTCFAIAIEYVFRFTADLALLCCWLPSHRVRAWPEGALVYGVARLVISFKARKVVLGVPLDVSS